MKNFLEEIKNIVEKRIPGSQLFICEMPDEIYWRFSTGKIGCNGILGSPEKSDVNSIANFLARQIKKCLSLP